MSASTATTGRVEIEDLERATGIEGPPRVLIVDDDELVLSALRTVFQLETDYHLCLEIDVRAALRTVAETNVDVVISDFLMPEMDGLSFLKEVRKLRPAASLILLSGHADRGRVIEAVGELSVQYMEKPWSNDELLRLVRKADRP